ncbi:MAG: hypothetical protein HN427_05775 [Flavobacteriales bacterium]|jgi:hypothetical protein|nr:hypothetical protein [Flavobacteriales bacterium]MBT7481866.1 hypothetical protein [Flavobacteriales bacterium]
MKKLMYLLVVGVMFAFTACSGGDDAKIGCQAGEECVEDHSCCATEEVTEEVAVEEVTEEVAVEEVTEEVAVEEESAE